MKEIKFRIIELEDYQVLLTKDFDSNEGNRDSILVVTVFFNGVKIKATISFSDDKKRDEYFIEFSDKKAQIFIDNIKKDYNV